jgi:HSP20 family protein
MEGIMSRLVSTKKPKYYIQDLQEEMNRIFEDAFGSMGLAEPLLEKQEMTWKPAVEMYEENGFYKIKAELPGVDKDKIDVEVGEDSVIIKAETSKQTEEHNERYYKNELRYGKFMRQLPLPTEGKVGEAKAEFKDGILMVSIPKTEEKERKITKLTIES